MTKDQSAVVGFIVAPFLATLPLHVLLNGGFAYFLDLQAWTILFFLTYASVGVFGVPIYFVARNRLRYSAPILSCVGFTIGFCCCTAILVSVMPLVPEMIWLSFRVGLCGAFGGLAFWVLTKNSHETFN